MFNVCAVGRARLRRQEAAQGRPGSGAICLHSGNWETGLSVRKGDGKVFCVSPDRLKSGLQASELSGVGFGVFLDVVQLGANTSIGETGLSLFNLDSVGFGAFRAGGRLPGTARGRRMAVK